MNIPTSAKPKESIYKKTNIAPLQATKCHIPERNTNKYFTITLKCMCLKTKIENKKAKICILGLGYVGYPLACSFSKTGFKVIGYDIDNTIVEKLNNKSTMWDYKPSKSFTPTSNPANIKDADIYIITVPTPLKENNVPDLSYIESAADTIRKYIQKQNLVILESTTYPGTTEEYLKKILEKSGLKVGDFYLAYSPERIDPGSKHKLEDIPKIIGGINETSTEITSMLYSTIIKTTIKVSSPRVAEGTKILENIFRNVNIALINELSKVFEKLDIDIWEVIESAKTKPYAFMAHYPGPGVGGHCIPLDPFYLTYKARKEGIDTRFIELSGEINQSMPYYVCYLTKKILAKKNKKLEDSKISVLGTTYKKNIPDTRETPSRVIINELKKDCNELFVFDPHAEEVFSGTPVNFETSIKDRDCIILAVDHDYFRKNNIEDRINELSPNCCILDTRHFLIKEKLNKNILYKCLGS